MGSLALAALLTGCLGSPAGASPARTPLPPTGSADYQLGGAYNPPAGVSVVARDSTDSPAPGLYSICYLNGFQTQPDSKRWWLLRHPGLVLRDSAGQPIFDPGWPDEMILDTSTASKRRDVAAVLGKFIAGCASKGFQAVEFDNLDSYTRSHGKLTLSNNLTEAKQLVARAHALGLSAAQKNTTELGSRGKTVARFDFAVSEECYKWDECSAYTDVYGRNVLDIEYTDDLRGTFASACAAASAPARTILRDRELVTPDDPNYAYAHC